MNLPMLFSWLDIGAPGFYLSSQGTQPRFSSSLLAEPGFSVTNHAPSCALHDSAEASKPLGAEPRSGNGAIPVRGRYQRHLRLPGGGNDKEAERQ
jgi:hypothetical protein